MSQSAKGLRPRDVYYGTTKEKIQKFLQREELEVIAFRQPQIDERFLSAQFGDFVRTQMPNFEINGHRLIVK